jgi:transcriptional regulator with XRE-family HTH domain
MTQNKDLGEILSRIIEENNLEQKILAREVGISPSHLSRIVNGRQPSRETLQKLVDALLRKGISAAEIANVWQVSNFPAQTSSEDLKYQQLIDINRMIGELEVTGKEDIKDILDDLMTIIDVDISIIHSGPLLKARIWPSAIEMLSETEKRLGRLHSSYNKLYEKLAFAHYGGGNYSPAILYNHLALQSIDEMQKRTSSQDEKEILDSKRGSTYILIGNIYRRQACWIEARKYYEVALNLFKQLRGKTNKEEEANCQRKLAAIDNYQGHPDDAILRLDESVRISKAIDYQKGLYKALQHRAWSNRIIGNWDQSIKENHEALDNVLKEQTDPWEIMKAYNYLGDSFYDCEKYTEAKDNYSRAKQIFDEQHGDEAQMRLQEGMIRLAMGTSSMKPQPFLPDAQLNLEGSLKSFINMGDEFWAAVARQSLGEFYLERDILSKAEAYLKIASAQYKQLDVPRHYVSSLVDLCNLSLKKRDLKDVQNYIESAMQVQQLENMHHIKLYLERFFCVGYVTLGKSYLLQDQYNNAEIAFQQALNYANDYNEYILHDCANEISHAVDQLTRADKLEEAIKLSEECISVVQSLPKKCCSEIALETVVDLFKNHRDNAITLFQAWKT